MKVKILLLSFLITAFMGLSQESEGFGPECKLISGPGNPGAGQPVTFYFNNPNLAQCSQCFDWDITGLGATINGDDRNSSVSVTFNNPGTFYITVIYFNEDGCHSCTATVVAEEPCTDQIVPAEVVPDLLDINTSGVNGHAGDISLNMFEINNLNLNNGAIDHVNYYAEPFAGVIHFNGSQSQTSNPIGNTTTGYRAYFTYDASGGGDARHFFFTATITHTNGCKTIIGPLKYLVPNTFVNRQVENYHVGQNFPLKIQNSNNNKLIIYPNPSKEFLHFEGADLDTYQLRIFDFKGKQVLERKILKKLNIQNFEKGVYFYKISNESGVKQEGKFIKE